MYVLLLAAALADTPVESLPEPVRERFAAAELAWTSEDYDGALAAYTAVNEAAPEFDRAWRRRCGVELAVGRVDQAVTLCRKAVALVPSVENQTGLAIAVMQTESGSKEASELLEGAVKANPEFLPAWQGLCTWAMSARQAEPLARCVVALERLAPQTAGTYFYRSLLLAEQGNFEQASVALQYAGQEGLTEELLGAGGAWIEDHQRKAQEEAGSRTVTKKDRKQGWSASDLIPVFVLVALVLAVVVLAFGREDDAPAEAPKDPPTPPPAPPTT